MQKYTLALVVIIIVLLTVLFNSNTSQVEQIDSIKLGVLLPLTGNNAAHGELAKRGVELALENLPSNIQVVYEDSQFDGSVSVNAYKKLVTQDKVQAILTLGSPVAMSIASLANEDKVLLLGIVAAPAYSTPDDYTFRIVGSATVEADSIVDTIVNTLNKKKVAILSMGNDYGKGTASEFVHAFKDHGEVIFNESFLPEETDFRSSLIKIKSLNPDIIFIPATGREAGLIIKQAREQGIETAFICAQACQNPDLVTIAGGSAEGLLVVAPTDDANSNFIDLYSDKYTGTIHFGTIKMYDATKILSSVFANCEKDNYAPACLLRGMNNVTDYPGTSFPINFDENGDMNDQFLLKIVKNGAFVKY